LEVLAPHALPDLVQVLQDVGTVAAEPPPTDGPLPGRACSASLMCQLTSKRGAKGTLRPLDALLVAQVRQTARPILPAPVRFLYRVHSPVNRGSRRTQPHRCHHPRRNQGLITPPSQPRAPRAMRINASKAKPAASIPGACAELTTPTGLPEVLALLGDYPSPAVPLP